MDTRPHDTGTLTARRLKWHAQDEAIILMRTDCPVCRSEGLTSRTRVLVSCGDKQVVASLHQTEDDWLSLSEAGLSEAAWTRLGAEPGAALEVTHAPTLPSLSDVRRRMTGKRLSRDAFDRIISDIAEGSYSDVHLAAFVSACSTLKLDIDEMTSLTGAMVKVGEQLAWDQEMIVDKHCVGGLPGNRTTPIVVAILSSLGLTIPKTSSRAITSPAGTADTMETLTRVDLSLADIRRVVAAEGGCLAWGGAVQLSPADDILIRIERALDIDAEGQLIASVLSKKIAAGATHVVLDLPVGPTAKLRGTPEARALAQHMTIVAGGFGVKTKCVFSDGLQPVGRGIGPALEAWDVLRVLQGSKSAPPDLRQRAISLAGTALELAGHAKNDTGVAIAQEALASGSAWAKFQAICAAQGGLREPPRAAQTAPLTATHSGKVKIIDNRKLSRLAKLAGAPERPAAGLTLHKRLGDEVASGEPLVTIHAEAAGEIAYAMDYATANSDIFTIEA
ncbi:MAG TPA: thymidine phosphorylase [Hyphomonas sp.]|jgi:thymidine phosphorylase|nr:thymidine phosphorylase [Hyphomonadaceae bacterium]HBL93812.1 thymidine phosphorylase [Hyphomonas sp.]HCJ18768.1 thymidine phosphorylase [Hyphomonas sp.]